MAADISINVLGEQDDGRITVERRGFVQVMGIDRQHKRNSFTPKMHAELQAAYVALDEEPELRVGLLFGHGGHFTAGLDLPRYGDLQREGRLPIDPEKTDPWARWKRCRKPVVCAASGITYTAGIELMLACDIVIAAQDCRFSQLEARRGIMPGSGAIPRFIQRGGWGNAMYHLLTCDEFTSPEAFRIGLVQEVVEPGTECARALEIAQRIALNAPLAIEAIRQNGFTYLLEGEQRSLDACKAIQSRLAMTEDAQEGVRSFLEKRPPDFRRR